MANNTVATLINPMTGSPLFGYSYAFTGNETGDTIELPIGDRSVQLKGTWNSATVVIEGSNDGTNFVTLTDGLGNALSFTADGLKNIGELTRYIRARVSSGSVTACAITFIAKRS